LDVELETSRRDALKAMRECFKEVDPRKLVRRSVHLKRDRLFVGAESFDLGSFDNITVIGGGKASALMASETEEILGRMIGAGMVIVPDYQRQLPRLKRIMFLKSTHPLPSRMGVAAVEEMLGLVAAVGERDLVLCLMSGGGSALMPLPIEGVSLSDKRRVTEMLLKSGAGIREVNCVRKHLSAFKGGRLAEMLSPATVISLIVSDVVGDDLASIASGPTVPDGTTFAEAEGILKRAGLWEKVPPTVGGALEKGASGEIRETPKPGSAVFDRVHNVLIGSNTLARSAASRTLRRLGYSVSEIADVQGEARKFGARLGRSTARRKSMTAIVAGGETVVTVRGRGRGGRNQEIALAAALEISGRENVAVLSFSTDGMDGLTDAAGAMADGVTVKRGTELDMSAEKCLNDNDSYPFFKKLGDLVVTGPTGTNVNDISLAVIRPSTSMR
jgi:hydroxypyruvate reductase